MKRNLLICFSFLLISSVLMAQDRVISGKVTSADDGSTLPGVNIVVKGSTTGAVSDADGQYKISVPGSGGTLIFSFIGMLSQEIEIGDKSTIDVVLVSDATQLSEIVVIGYGQQDKRTLSSAISSVKGSDIAALPVQSFDQALVGKASGVQVSVQSGLVGQAPRIRIRGTNSITSGSQPLYVVDGVPMVSGNPSGVAQQNLLGDINPNDIQSIDVLKDGAATAIYGSRAANGVILITTKSGKSGKVKVNYDYQMGFNTIAKRFSLLDADQFIAISNEKFASSNTTTPQAYPGPNNENTDWQDVIFRTGIMQNHNLNISGGSSDVSYFISAGYMKQDGAVVNNSVDRYSMRANLDYTGVKWMSAGLKLGITRQVNNGLNTGSNALSGNIPSALKAFPNVPVYDASHPLGYNITSDNRALGRGNNLLDIASSYTNVQYTLDHNKQEADNYRTLANGYLQFNLMEGLNIRTQLGADITDNEDFLTWDPFHGDGGGSTQGIVFRGDYRIFRWNWQNTLNFKKTFATDHNIGVTVGYEAQRQTERSFYGQGQTFSDPSFLKYELIGGAYTTQTSGGDFTENGFSSYFGRLNYDFKGRYLLGASVRNDALSSLPKANRQGTFLGGSLGWIVSQESFFSIPTVSLLKVRGSYAEVGNTFISNFGYIGTYSPALYGTQAGNSFSQAGNSSLQWETSKKLDVGLDVALFNNRITASFEYYKNNIDGLILAAPTAPTAGIPGNSISKNVGSMVNSGFEVTIGTDNLKGKAISWTTDVTLTTNKNEITALNAGQDIIGTWTVNRVGQPINSLYLFEYAGVAPANGNPLYIKGDGTMVQGNPDNNTYYLYDPEDPNNFSTANATTALSSTDLKVVGQTNPKWFGGFNNTVTWKGIELGVFLTYAGGNKIFNASRQSNMQLEFTNNSKEILNRWTPENPNTDVPRLKYANSSFLNLNSTRFVENGDYLRIQNIALGYSLPKNVLNFAKGSISSVRITAQVRNAYVFTKYKGMDPELNSGTYGVDNLTNPLLRTFTFGLSIGL